MDTKLRHEKEIGRIPDRSTRLRETQVRQLQEEYGYGLEDANKVYEMQ